MVHFPRSTDGDSIFDFDNKLNSRTTLGGLFGGRTDDAKFVVDSSKLRIETKSPTKARAASRQATLIISKVQNPPHVGRFGSFGIYVYDKDKELIA